MFLKCLAVLLKIKSIGRSFQKNCNHQCTYKKVGNVKIFDPHTKNPSCGTVPLTRNNTMLQVMLRLDPLYSVRTVSRFSPTEIVSNSTTNICTRSNLQNFLYFFIFPSLRFLFVLLVYGTVSVHLAVHY
jgi:hypothetical protein